MKLYRPDPPLHDPHARLGRLPVAEALLLPALRHAGDRLAAARAAAPLGHALRRRDAHRLRRQGSRVRARSTRLCREGVIVDISEDMHDFAIIKPTPHHRPHRGQEGRHPPLPHRLPPLLQRRARGGRGALLPASSGRRPRVRRVDRGDGAGVDGVRLRVRRQPGEHLDPHEVAAGDRRPVREADRPRRRRGLPGRRPVRDAQGAVPRRGSPTSRTSAATSTEVGTTRCLIGAFPIPIVGRRGLALPGRRLRRGLMTAERHGSFDELAARGSVPGREPLRLRPGGADGHALSLRARSRGSRSTGTPRSRSR